MSIKVKMSIILAPLVAGLTFYSVNDLMVKEQVIDNTDMILSTTQLLERTGGVVHELQKERGASVALLSGDVSFRTKLDEQRKHSEEAINALKKFTQSESYQRLDKSIKTIVDGFERDIGSLQSWQQNIDGQSVSIQRVVPFYSERIKSLQEIIPAIVETNPDPKLSPLLIAIQSILEIKEQAGIERAVISNILAAKTINDTALMRASGLREAQEQYIAQFKLYAPEDIKLKADSIFNQDVFTKVEAVRQQVLSRSLQVTASDWFVLSTERISLLKKIEGTLEAYLFSMANKQKQEAEQNLTFSLVMFLALLTFNTSVGLIFTRSMSRIEKGLFQLADVMKKAAHSKDLSLRVTYPHKDDVGEVAQAFNKMMYDFCELISHIRDTGNQLATAAQQTFSSASNSAQELEGQMANTLLVTSAIEELSASVSEISDQLSSVHQTIQQVYKESTTAETAVSTSVTDIQHLSDEVGKINQGILDVSKNSKQITSVLSVIHGIADQTNLLALNAAIEAARAGETGRGFAVVADEVRGLAKRTQDSTVEIETMVTTLQASVSNMSAMISASQNMVTHSVDLSLEVSAALSAIFKAIDNAQQLTDQISLTTQQQATVSGDVARNATAISMATESSVTHSQQIASVSEELSKLASSLSKTTNSFKTV